METRVRFIVVGAFALAAIVGVFLFAWWIHAAGGFARTRAIDVEFAGAAAGLRPGSAVQYNGVRVGEVTSIAFDPKRANVVDAVLAVDATAPVRADAKVAVESQGLLGATVVAIYGVSADAPLLKAGAVLQATSPPALMEQARAALADLQSVVDDNKAAFKDTIKNISAFAGALGRNSGRVDSILAGLEQFLGHGPKPPAPQFLTLAAPKTFPAMPQPSGQIAVAEVTAPVGFQTQKIMSRAREGGVITLGEMQWTEATPKLIQLKLVDAFQNAGLGGAVGLAFDSGQPDFQLLLELRRFEIDLWEKKAVVEISARIVGKDGRVAEAKLFSAAAPAAVADGEPAAEALSQAFGETAKAIVAWTAEATK